MYMVVPSMFVPAVTRAASGAHTHSVDHRSLLSRLALFLDGR
jgi:hypothetical protein